MIRTIVSIALILACVPSFASAQERKPPKIEKIEVGFQTYRKDDETAYKVGLWTPIYIEVSAGTEAIELKKGNNFSYLEIQTVDSEEVGTIISLPVTVEAGQTRTFMGYVKTGRMGFGSNEVQVTLHVAGRKYEKAVEQYHTLNIDAHLYLTIGPRMNDAYKAVRNIGKRAGLKDDENDDGRERARHVVFENDVKRLPEVWFGYNSVDLLVLSTESEKFLLALNNSQERLKAIAQWVRRGGRLVIPIAYKNQHLVTQLLESKLAWEPPIPPQVVPPRTPGDVAALSVPRLPKVEDWANIPDRPFIRENGEKIAIARLDSGLARLGDWEVFADTADGRPLIAQVRYGLGQITYVAFSFEDVAFSNWGGRSQFLAAMFTKLGPRAPDQMDERGGGFVGKGRDIPNDLSTDLLMMLDNFDVTIIPFGYVALFIVLYILVVGPLDFILLKFVFKRLEWTWITFPAVVLVVSVVAYFAAYALKGRDLKINKVDVVDFDLRTSLDDKRKPQNVRAYGHSFFTILSPRIQNYTIGLEPSPTFWGGEVRKVKLREGKEVDEVLSVDLMSWMGRPSGGPNDMRRGGSSGFFRKPYEYAEDASGLRGVPIPVWTTKAFCASWEHPVTTPPFTVDLIYHTKEEIKLSGKLDNHLGVDLVDAWIIYQERCYQIPGGLPKLARGGVSKEIVFPVQGPMVPDWIKRFGDDAVAPEERQAWNANMPTKMKELLFRDRFDTQNFVRNHLWRPLDLGWRITEDRRAGGTREAILFARTRPLSGRAEELNSDFAKPLPTKVWLGDLPDPTKERPALVGHMNQETYIRAILPVRPAE